MTAAELGCHVGTSVVRPITMASASALIVIGPPRSSLVRAESWVARPDGRQRLIVELSDVACGGADGEAVASGAGSAAALTSNPCDKGAYALIYEHALLHTRDSADFQVDGGLAGVMQWRR